VDWCGLDRRGVVRCGRRRRGRGRCPGRHARAGTGARTCHCFAGRAQSLRLVEAHGAAPGNEYGGQADARRLQTIVQHPTDPHMTAISSTATPSSQIAQLPVIGEPAQQSYPTATLYVVATPIGNVTDITLRALHVLLLADVVACEDTRKTGALLGRFGLTKQMVAAHQHNEREVAEKLIQRLRAGERVALVSDAGTPAVSDPGARI